MHLTHSPSIVVLGQSCPETRWEEESCDRGQGRVEASVGGWGRLSPGSTPRRGFSPVALLTPRGAPGCLL